MSYRVHFLAIMWRSLGKLYAVIWHPAFHNVYLFWLVFPRITPISVPIWIWIDFALFTAILPALFPLIIAKDLFLKDKRQRPVPLLLTALSYSILLAQIITIPALSLLQPFGAIIIGQILGLTLIAIVSPHTKVSLHSLGIAYLPFAVLSLINPYYFLPFPLLAVGLAAWFSLAYLLIFQRFVSKAHTPHELSLGLALGIFAGSALLWL